MISGAGICSNGPLKAWKYPPVVRLPNALIVSFLLFFLCSLPVVFFASLMTFSLSYNSVFIFFVCALLLHRLMFCYTSETVLTKVKEHRSFVQKLRTLPQCVLSGGLDLLTFLRESSSRKLFLCSNNVVFTSLSSSGDNPIEPQVEDGCTKASFVHFLRRC